MNHRIFISYSGNDKELAFAVCEILESAGIKCWIAPRDIPPGTVFGEELTKAIMTCDVFLLLFTRSSNISRHVANEVGLAFDFDKILILYRIEDVALSLGLKYYMSRSQWVEGVYAKDSGNYADLVENIIGILPEDKAQTELLSDPEELIKGMFNYLSMGEDVTSNEKLRFLKLTLNKLQFPDLLEEFIGNPVGDKIDDGQLNEVEQENNTDESSSAGTYDILQNKQGELTLLIDNRSSIPKEPRVIFDKEHTIVLYRNRESVILLERGNVDMAILSALQTKDEILVAEFDKKGNSVFEYHAPLEQVKDVNTFLVSDYKGTYSILQNEQGELTLLIDSYPSAPEKNPRLIFDEEGAILLYRNRESIVFLRNLDSITLSAQPLQIKNEILVIEFDEDGNRVFEYYATSRRVENIEASLANNNIIESK